MTSADDLRPVPIQELRLLAEGRRWQVDQHLSELQSLTPVRGSLSVVHRGNVLELAGEASTIVTLCCDRCLQQFNHSLSFSSHELLWLGEQARTSGIEAEKLLGAGGSTGLGPADPAALCRRRQAGQPGRQPSLCGGCAGGGAQQPVL